MALDKNAQLDRFIGRKELLRLTGIPQSTLYAMMKEGSFPKGVKITARRVGWRESTIRKWQNSRRERYYA